MVIAGIAFNEPRHYGRGPFSQIKKATSGTLCVVPASGLRNFLDSEALQAGPGTAT